MNLDNKLKKIRKAVNGDLLITVSVTQQGVRIRDIKVRYDDDSDEGDTGHNTLDLENDVSKPYSYMG